jgi:aryl-alcohol dehydrogenase-like predicted oxidoreductase
MSESRLGSLPVVSIGGDLSVGRLGFGAMQLTGPQVWGDYPDRDAGIALLRGVVERGVTFIDTADVYGPHFNELLIRDALHPYTDGLVIATKGGFVRGGFDYSTLDAVGNVSYLRQSAHMSARRLGVEQIDLYYLHSGRAKDAPFEDQVGALAELRQQGVIRHIGLSNVTVEQFKAATEIVAISAVTAVYNVAVRAESALVAATQAYGAVFSPWHPLTITDAGPEVAARIEAVMAPIAEAHDATISQIALAWQLRSFARSLPIPGTTNFAHLEENLAAVDLDLTDEEIAAITGLASE